MVITKILLWEVDHSHYMNNVIRLQKDFRKKKKTKSIKLRIFITTLPFSFFKSLQNLVINTSGVHLRETKNEK